MRKRVLSIILALCMYASAIPSAYALQTDFSPQENPSAEEHAAELLHYADETRVPTYQEAHDAMMALQPELYEGRPWTNLSSGDYTWHGGPLDGNVRTGVGCVAFAFRLSDAAFGNLPARMYRKSSGPLNFSDVKVGDILRERNDSHTVIVTQVSEGGLILAEGNYNKSIHWGRPMDKDYFDANVTTWITRYPQGYIEPDDPTANDPVAGGTGTLVGGLNWKLTNAGTLTISGSGAMPDFETMNGQPWYSLNSSILKIVIDNGVTHVGNYAFYGSSALSVNLPNTITSIGNGAFRKSSIVSMTIPNSVKTIGDDAFHECKNLDHMNIPEGVQSIGERAFQGCEAFTSVNLPASIQSVGAGAFYNCTKLRNVHFTPGATHTVSIGANTFTGCWALMTITLPSKINRISPGMFTSCISLSYMIIPEGTTEIANTAFSSSGVSVVFIPTSIKYMGVEGDTPFGPGEGSGNPFAGCRIKDIYFAGTQAQWNAIQKASAIQQTLATATVHYDFPHEHTWSDGVTTPPDGEDDGFTTYTCIYCGEIKRDIISATDPGTDPDPGHTHTWDEGIVTKAATCTEAGVRTYTCTYSGCNETKTESIPATGHKYGDYVVTKQPTSTEPGERTATCTVCGDVKTEVIPATGSGDPTNPDNPDHTHTWDEGTVTTPATCTEDGVKTFTCTVCKQTKTEPIPATGHRYETYTVTKTATCMESGIEISTCANNCGTTQSRTIPRTAHSYGAYTVTKAATCMESGIETSTCTNNCGTTQSRTIPRTAHSYGAYTVTTPATCISPGTRTSTCSICGNTRLESIPATGVHSYGEPTVTTPATCTEPGKQERTCSVCGNIQEEIIPAIGHSYEDYKVTTEATCIKNGIETSTCANNCGATQSRVIPATGHNYGDPVTTPAKCTEDGKEERTCSNCGDVQTKVISASGHDFSGFPDENGNYVCQNDGCDVAVAPVQKEGYEAIQKITLEDIEDGKSYVQEENVKQHVSELIEAALASVDNSDDLEYTVETIDYQRPTRGYEGYYVYTVTISQRASMGLASLKTETVRMVIPRASAGEDDLKIVQDDYANQYTANIAWNGDNYTLSLIPETGVATPNPDDFIMYEAIYALDGKMTGVTKITGELDGQILAFSGEAPRTASPEVTYKLFLLDKNLTPIIKPRVSPSIAQN